MLPGLGSPPRVRGRVEWPCSGLRRVGITPARAGKRPPPWGSGPLSGDHPRACGEEMESKLPCRQWEGSPPRVRGRGRSDVQRGGRRGITPARAGKRAGSWPGRPYNWDHPRACGEEIGGRYWLHGGKGSPPRVRGRGQGRRSFGTKKGITPARAGKSCRPVDHARALRDHPRACGEEPRVLSYEVRKEGSPPRVRGRAPCAKL